MNAPTSLPERRVDMHVHAKLSKAFAFEPAALQRSVARARRLGLDGFVLTEHFHTIDFWGMQDQICRLFPYADGVWTVDSQFRILTGAELGVQESADILLLGTLGQLRDFDRWLARPASRGYKPPFQEATEVARESGVMLIGAHMFRPNKELARIGEANFGYLEAFELNGKDGHRDDDVRAIAAMLNCPVVGGSDAHWWAQVGIRMTMFLAPELTPQYLARAIRARETQVVGQPWAAAAVQVSRAYKYLVKTSRHQRSSEIPARARHQDIQGHRASTAASIGTET